MAFPQAPIEMDLYMELPHGITVKGGSSKTHVLKLLTNIYGQKQGAKVWHDHLVSKLQSIGFTRSSVDDCVFYRGTTIFVVYVDDGLAFDSSGDNLDEFIQELRDTGLNIEDMGHPSDYIGVNLSKDKDTFHFTQRALIDSTEYFCSSSHQDLRGIMASSAEREYLDSDLAILSDHPRYLIRHSL